MLVQSAGLVIIEGANEAASATRLHTDGRPSHGHSVRSPITLRHFALQELLGADVLTRTVARLEHHGIQPVAVLAESENANDSWPFVERKLVELSAKGVDSVVIVRLGSYAEIDFSDLLRFHENGGEVVTCVHDDQGPLQICVFNLSARAEWLKMRRDLFRSFRQASSRYEFRGYVNRLESAADFRRLTVDALNRRCQLQPIGTEVRPGVWLGQGARIHQRARVVAPAYVGAQTRVRAGALITKTSSIERNSEVDSGTIVGDSNVLPGSYVGPGLEVAHAMVDGSRLLHLGRNLELELFDGRLLSPITGPAIQFPWLPLRRPRPAAVPQLAVPTDSAQPASLYSTGYSAGEIAPSS
ncbi:MAG TPA: hypothetical protein VFA89_13930 [Terriglobales bacterium]|nr:hypothetical protein [Terriglobales bacterium]